MGKALLGARGLPDAQGLAPRSAPLEGTAERAADVHTRAALAQNGDTRGLLVPELDGCMRADAPQPPHGHGQHQRERDAEHNEQLAEVIPRRNRHKRGVLPTRPHRAA